MLIYEIQLNERDLSNYPECCKLEPFESIKTIERAVNIVIENHFKDKCEVLSIEYYKIQCYFIVTISIHVCYRKALRRLLSEYPSVSHYHCL
jgi:hypothetical protein